MEDNIVKSTDVNKKAEKPKEPKVAKEEVITAEEAAPQKAAPKAKKIADERNVNESVATAPDGYKFVFFDSGASYTSTSGVRFTRENCIQMLPVQEADHLLAFDNFRIPTQLELQDYAARI